MITTAWAPPPGINWQAVILQALNLGVEPTIAMDLHVGSRFNIAVVPKVGFLPPQSFSLKLTPHINMSGGAEVNSSFNLKFEPAIGRIVLKENGGVHVTPSLGFTGSSKSTGSFAVTAPPSLGPAGGSRSVGSFGLTLTPSLSMSAAAVERGRQLNTAVMRASTI